MDGGMGASEDVSLQSTEDTIETGVSNMENIHTNVKTSFSPEVSEPDIAPTAYVHPLAAVIGAVHIGERVMVSPAASVRGDEGQTLWVGDESNVQDGVILHALETWSDGEPVEGNLVTVDGEKYAIYVGDRVSLAHQVHVHGPASVGDDTFVGMQSMVFKSEVGEGCVIEPKSLVMGVTIADGRYVPAGSVIKAQEDADALPEVTDDYAFKNLNEGVVHVNVHLADAYNAGDS
jgi:carbonic anhydrase/acetyltransferase-like protein (isoleucine patch superfamily)